MKKTLFFLVLCLLIVTCKQKESNTTETSLPEENQIQETQATLDYDSLILKIKSSTTIDMDTFFAISICQKQYIMQFEEEITEFSDTEKLTFNNQKNLEFFKMIPFNQQQYLDFYQNNQEGMLDYINKHPEVAPYLVTMQ